MKIIIEVEGGMVAGVYYDGAGRAALPVYVVDLDMANLGEDIKAEPWGAKPLRCADKKTREAVKQ